MMFNNIEESILGRLDADNFGFEANLAAQSILRLLNYAMLFTGIYLWYKGIQVDHNKLLLACFIINFAMHLPSLFYV